MKKKVIISSVAILALAIAGYFIFLGSSTRKYDFRFDKVSKGDVTMYVTATGTINAVTSVDVGTQVSGIICKLYADFNSVVKRGQVIAQIDSTFLVQSVKDAEASLDKAKAQYADSKRNYEREKTMLEKGLDSQLNFDAALTAYESNTASVKSAQAALDRAKINLAYATIYAPIDGVVINRAVNVGQTVAASFSSPTLYTIANDLRKMQVQTTVDETDIGTISIGQGATFTVDSYPSETFNGTVSQIRLAPVTIQNVVNYTVVVDVNNDQLKLMPGMTASVKVLVANAHDVLRVSNMALRFQAPADLIDSTKLKAMREAMSSGGRAGEDTSRAGSKAGTSNEPGGDRHRQFGTMRDSILAAHGGNLSQEEMRSEMGKVFQRMQGSANQLPFQQRERTLRVPQSTPFGITNTFPAYEKNPYIPQHQSGRARVWVLNAKGKLEPVFVRTGVTDGKSTEITSTDLKEGDQIIMGVTSNSEVASSQNPLTGGGQGRPPMGGGFR